MRSVNFVFRALIVYPLSLYCMLKMTAVFFEGRAADAPGWITAWASVAILAEVLYISNGRDKP